jgi:hypothetical protein
MLLLCNAHCCLYSLPCQFDYSVAVLLLGLIINDKNSAAGYWCQRYMQLECVQGVDIMCSVASASIFILRMMYAIYYKTGYSTYSSLGDAHATSARATQSPR